MRPSSISSCRGRRGGEAPVVGDHDDRRALARCSSSSRSKSACPVALSRLPVGSSARTMAGRPTSARAIATRWRSPPESWVGRAASLCASPTRPSASAASSRRSAAATPGVEQPVGHVVEGGLRARPGRTAGRRSRCAWRAGRRARGRVSRATSRPVIAHLPGRRPVERAHEVQQGRLARARGAERWRPARPRGR